MAEANNGIANSLAEMKLLANDQLYLALSKDFASEAFRWSYAEAEASLSEEARREMTYAPVAGLYGPLSAVWSKLSGEVRHQLEASRHAVPTIEQGKQIFAQKWASVQQKICGEWGYCERKREFSDEDSLIIALVTFIVADTNWQVRTAIAVLLLASHEGPKFICNCGDIPEPTKRKRRKPPSASARKRG